ncbi:hypothetical protein T265_03165 [Opisthorchis viverrini]|uniref:Uncharacterized protein n=1 Tax=Opisthorchis viverrini TaxID=6198 RepID=A0A074ZSN2_OPIVI|nr:hypothetical protein T265_03165 [Opisthorchis viverrini]KER30433.1 hypothetical protein T265_03165 [Opisthorchis viverrini]
MELFTKSDHKSGIVFYQLSHEAAWIVSEDCSETAFRVICFPLAGVKWNEIQSHDFVPPTTTMAPDTDESTPLGQLNDNGNSATTTYINNNGCSQLLGFIQTDMVFGGEAFVLSSAVTVDDVRIVVSEVYKLFGLTMHTWLGKLYYAVNQLLRSLYYSASPLPTLIYLEHSEESMSPLADSIQYKCKRARNSLKILLVIFVVAAAEKFKQLAPKAKAGVKYVKLVWCDQMLAMDA